MNNFSFIYFISFLMFSTSAFAGEALPAHWKYSSEIDSKQFGYTDVHIKKDGTVSASTLFSNGKRYDGDHFVTRISIYGPDNKPMLGFQYGAGVNATGGFGSAKEVRVGKSAALDHALADKVEWVGVQHFAKDSVDDEEFWKVVRKVIEAVYKALSEDDSSSSQGYQIGNISVTYYVSIDGIGKTQPMPPNTILLPKAIKASLAPKTSSGGNGSSSNNGISHKIYEDIFCQNANCTQWIRR